MMLRGAAPCSAMQHDVARATLVACSARFVRFRRVFDPFEQPFLD